MNVTFVWHMTLRRRDGGSRHSFETSARISADCPCQSVTTSQRLFSSPAWFFSVTVSFLALCSSLFASPNILSGPRYTKRLQQGRIHALKLLCSNSAKFDGAGRFGLMWPRPAVTVILYFTRAKAKNNPIGNIRTVVYKHHKVPASHAGTPHSGDAALRPSDTTSVPLLFS